MPKVSVIVPIYKVEKYIERCAKSLFEQTLDDIEFIFVNDCTEDKSIEILNQIILDYPVRKKQIKIVNHQKNLGLPFARKSGLNVSTGDYIAHCDSDDWVDKDFYEKAYNEAVRIDADVVITDTDTTNGLSHCYKSGGNVNDVKYCIVEMMYKKMWWSLCHMLYRRDVYKNTINYPIYGMGEDMCLTLQLLYYCSTIAYTHNSYYHYILNTSSIVRNNTEENCVLKYKQLYHNVDIVNKFYCSKADYLFFKKGIDFLYYDTRFPLLPFAKKKELKHIWRYSNIKSIISVIFNNKVNVRTRLKAILLIFGLYPIK